MKPHCAVQALTHRDAEKYLGVLGSAFRLWSPKHYITANHCIENLYPENIGVLNCFGQDLQCKSVYRHPTSDIAVLEIGSDIPTEFEQFELADFDWYYGTEVHCFGMVCHYGGRPANELARVLGGIVQRDCTYEDGTYKSECVELSFPIPTGMSGGPLFIAHAPNKVIGMAIANIKSELVVSSQLEYKNQKEIWSERVSEITQYGVALRLYPLKEWFESVIPKQS